MPRPKSVELTDRELAIMQLFWKNGEGTSEQAQARLEASGEKLAYATVANVIRSLADKGYLKQTNDTRPFRFVAVKKFEDVCRCLIGDLVMRLFSGSREAMFVQLLGRQKLTAKERDFLMRLLKEQEQS